MELGKSAYSVYKIRYQRVAMVIYHKALLDSELEERIKENLKGVSERYEIDVDGIGFEPNHTKGGI